MLRWSSFELVCMLLCIYNDESIIKQYILVYSLDLYSNQLFE